MAAKVELFIETTTDTPGDYFLLDDATKGKLDDTTYLLGGGPGAAGYPIDITDQTFTGTVRRGRSRQTDEFQAGSATVAIRNHDRDFDPQWDVLIGTSPAGTYGAIRPGKRLRISDENSVVFDGIVEDWNHDWTVDGDAATSLVAVDAIGRLGRQSFLEWTTTAGQTADERITAVLDRPEVDFPIGDRALDAGVWELQSDSVSWGSSVLNYLQLVARSDAGLLFADREGDVTFHNRHRIVTATAAVELGEAGHLDLDGTTGDYASTPDSAVLSPSGDFSVVVHGQPGTLPGTVTYLASKWVGSGNNRTWLIRVDTSDNVDVIVSSDGIASTFISNGTVQLADNTEFWYGFTFDANNGTVSEIRHWTSTDGNTWTQQGSADTHGSAITPYDSTAEVAVGGINSGASALAGDWYRVKVFNGIGDNTGPGLGTLVADFDPGHLPTTGGADWTNKTWTLNGSAAIVHTGIPFSALDVTFGTELLFTQATVDRENGVAQTVADQDAVNEFGVRPWPNTTPLLYTEDVYSRAMATHIVDRYAEPEAVVSSVRIILDTLTAAQRTSVVELDLGDLVTFDWTPTDTGQKIEQLLQVEGVDYEFAVGQVTAVVLQLSDASWRYGFLLDDTVDGVLDTSLLAF